MNIRLVPSEETQKVLEEAMNTKMNDEEQDAVLAFGTNMYREGLLDGMKYVAKGLLGVGAGVSIYIIYRIFSNRKETP